MKSLSRKETLSIGLMLFALFFGSGNLIFPPLLGQSSGTNVWIAVSGFIITGVGLPLLAVAALAKSGDSFQRLVNRVNPLFGVILTVAIYLTIGPLFVIPRTGGVAFEMGISPFLAGGAGQSPLILFLFTLAYFALTFWLCLNPSKLVDIIGKWLTPALLTLIAVLFIRTLIHPIGPIGEPTTTEYANYPFFKGFVEGYSTMDTLGALVFGIVIVTAIRERGVTDSKTIALSTIKAGTIAATGLGLVYIALGYIGATSQSFGILGNGGEILTKAAYGLLGTSGLVLLAGATTIACLTTSIGLTVSCGQYFSRLIPGLSYKAIVGMVCLFGMALANLGLDRILEFSVPVLLLLYPLVIVLILLSFFHTFFHGYSSVYIGGIIGSGIISLIDVLASVGIRWSSVDALLENLPVHEQGLGWLVPALLGIIIGYVFGRIKHRTVPA
ncbi:branched-chain amino acid transport system II carrier protein [Paenibacillus larvae]|nr:branched-chain amino acid transport system II carrier protein [Paenibacillus larvae]MDT2248479.1 branched-chain amino acid transport system II carrier protein [Paenibacillus larvae]